MNKYIFGCREAEQFASNKSHRVDSLSQQLSQKAEEIDHLREALTQTNEQLELERRLNKSIKQRKVLYTHDKMFCMIRKVYLSRFYSETDIV